MSLADTLSSVARNALLEQLRIRDLRKQNRPYRMPRLPPPPIHTPIEGDWPASFRSSIEAALSKTLKDGTIKNYNYGIRSFLKFCQDHNLPPEQCFPACDYLLCAFIANQKDTTASSTLRNHMSALKAWHVRNGFPFSRSDRLNILMKADRPLASKRPIRPPVTLAMLDLLKSDLNLSESRDSSIYACACVAFWGLARLGELLPDSYNFDRSMPPHPCYSSVSKGQLGSLTIALPWTKVSHWTGETLYITSQDTASPIEALQHHLTLTPLSPKALLFSFTDSHGISILLKHQFLKRCNDIWSSHGVALTSGHSFRIGGTTHLLLSGVHPDIIRKIGRWSSDSFFRYWRNLETVIPKRISNLPVAASGQAGEPRPLLGCGLQPVGLASPDTDSTPSARRRTARFAPT